MKSKLNVGIMGCGAISEIYLKTLTGVFADRVNLVAITDVMEESAKKRSEQFQVPMLAGPDEMLSHKGIDLIANLTPAPVHYQTTKQILAAGKHAYSEKPLALEWRQGVELYELAKKKRLRLAVAPDTILGAGVQSTIHLIRSGEIGNIATAQILVSLNTATARYFSTFRGPLMDLGPYPIAAMLAIMGPVKSVAGFSVAKRPFEPPMPEGSLDSSNPGNAAAAILFASGAVATLIASAETSRYLITHRYFGSKAWLESPDPNMFTGPITLHTGYEPPVEMPITHGFAENSRGVGIWDMADAIDNGVPHRLSPELSLHTLEVMLAVVNSNDTGTRIDMTTTFDIPEPMPPAAS